MTPPLGETTILVILGSVTRLLPLSDTGHIALGEMLANVAFTPEMLSSAALGAWLAMLLVVPFRNGAVLQAVAATRLQPRALAELVTGPAVRAVALGAVAMVVVELGVRDRIGPWGREPILVGAGWLVTAAATASTLWSPRGARDSITVAGALLVGAVEGAGSLPGLSRPGLALACLLWLGVRPSSAMEICFLMMLPAEAVISLVPMREPGVVLAWPTWTWTLLAAASGVVALLVLRGALARRMLPAVSLYLVPLGIATIAWGYARP